MSTCLRFELAHQQDRASVAGVRLFRFEGVVSDQCPLATSAPGSSGRIVAFPPLENCIASTSIYADVFRDIGVDINFKM
jgi:hypothetical protein